MQLKWRREHLEEACPDVLDYRVPKGDLAPDLVQHPVNGSTARIAAAPTIEPYRLVDTRGGWDVEARAVGRDVYVSTFLLFGIRERRARGHARYRDADPAPTASVCCNGAPDRRTR